MLGVNDSEGLQAEGDAMRQKVAYDAMNDAACDVRTDATSGMLFINASGQITVRTIGSLERLLRLRIFDAVRQGGFGAATIDMARVGALDTAGAWLVQQIAKDLDSKDIEVRYAHVRREHQGLLDEVAKNTFAENSATSGTRSFTGAASALSRIITSAVNEAVDIISYLGLFVSAVARLILSPSRFRLNAFTHHLEQAGVRAVPIIALICFLIGAVIMQQAALQLSYYGLETYSVDMLGMLALREVGVLLTVVMVAGRSASAFTAEIGSMKMREEISAMRTIGIDPVETLIVPRILALLVALPLLTFLGDLMCLAGGAVVAVFYLGNDLQNYIARINEAAELRHFAAGMIKTPFAAILIGIIGCSEGMKVAGSAESLGQHVTSAVVKAIFIVIIVGAALSIFLASIGS